MALTDGLRLGGVYADVGLNFDRLDTDLDELQRRLDAGGQATRLKVSADMPSPATPGAGSVGGPALAGLLAIGSTLRDETRRLTGQIARGIDDAIDQMRSAVASLKVVADATRSTSAAANDLYREQRRQDLAAGASAHLQRAIGRDVTVTRATGYGRLPADVRYLSGVGFDDPVRAVGRGARAAGAAVAQAQQELAPVVREILHAAGQQAREAAQDSGRTTLAGGYPLRPGPFTAAGATVAEKDLLGPGQTSVVRPDRSRRSGALFPRGGGGGGVLGYPDPIADRIVAALRPLDGFRAGLERLGQAARPVGGALLGLFRTARTGFNVFVGLADVGLLAFNRLGAGIRGVSVWLGRLREHSLAVRVGFGLVGLAVNTLLLPLNVASRAFGVLDSRASTATNTLRLLGRTAAAPITAPITAARVAADGLASSLHRAVSVARLLAIGMAARFAFNQAMSYAKSDKTTEALAGKALKNLQQGGAAVGAALQPAFQEIIALVLQVQQATAGVAPIFVTVAQSIGSAIANIVTFIRQVIANWGAAKDFIGFMFLQLVENARAAAGYIGEVFNRFLDWFANNWRTIFEDAFTIVADGIQNLAQNLWDLVQAVWKWIQDPLDNSFEFKVTPLIDKSKLKTSALELPEFKLQNDYAEHMVQAMTAIQGTALPTAKQIAEGITPNADGKKDKERSRVGELIGARELQSLFQQSAGAKEKDSRNLEKTADNTGKLIGEVQQVGKAISQRLVGVMGY